MTAPILPKTRPGRLVAFLFAALFFEKASAQTGAVFTPEEFLRAVGEFHPVAREAALLEQKTAAAVMGARGQFDPILSFQAGEKRFAGKTYYSYSEGLVRLPTWYGVEAQAGYATAEGDYLNPEEKLPKNGQAFAGASLSLWQGLLMDDRRAALARAKNLAFLNETERLAALNDLLFDAGKAYWDWAYSFGLVEMRRRFVELSQARFKGVRDAAGLGDRPPVDTLEALVQVLERRADLLESEADLRQNVQKLAVFLWRSDGQSQDLPKEARPVEVFSPTELGEAAADFTQNPAFRQYEFKLRELDIERRLKREKAKPKLDLSVALLADGTRFFPSGELAGQRLGVKFSWPVAARTARAEVQLAQIKIAETGLRRSLKGREIDQKIQFYQTEAENLGRQAQLLETILAGNRTLLEAERTRFQLGESSVFLLNSRENKLVETEAKRLKNAAALQKARLGRRWAAGALRLD